ncbi:hypothetical protein [Pseudomonas sp. RGM 3321]|uniref:hypothetical protein n=1 Tax=Pseudomonas sp. RGM 3321 TaxID=2930089 RepID=UPI001FCBCF1A|nr:hypothetical protein [Pseudomonas sp. RGM 3321]MCJ2375147.1 hypothetical protein [Pseudomonas sp. RGM 3321]
MTTEFVDLEPEDQEIVSDALGRAIATFQDVGLPVENLDHDELLTALVNLYMQVSGEQPAPASA